jgi:predicted transcriptional regulator of viral defense system
MAAANATDRARSIFRKHQGLLRTSEALALGISPRTLYALRDSGALTQLSRGVYRLSDMPPLGNADLVQVAIRVSQGVICLISALALHELTTQIPHRVYVALPDHAEPPRLEYPPLRIVWLSGQAYAAGIETHTMDGIPVQVYGVAKTVADCLKFRNKIGLDVALEALKESLRGPHCSVKDLLKYAQIDRVERVMRPYLEVLA